MTKKENTLSKPKSQARPKSKTQATSSKLAVTLGGGTGTFAVISALKNLPVELTSIVAVSDSGGSTGRIRDEFGFQPVGDLRQSLAALADPDEQDWIRKILLYRFKKGDGLQGHNLGNLILTALQDMTKDTTQALQIVEKVFGLQGSVIPVTDKTVDLKIIYEDGSSAVGEHLLDAKTKTPKPIKEVQLTPNCQLNPHAKQAILGADWIIIGPGDYYASLMAVLVTPGLKKALAQSCAQLIYIVNLMTRRNQTHDMTAQDHAIGMEEALGKQLDKIIINNQSPPKKIEEVYAQAQEFSVKDDLPQNDSRVVRAPLLGEVATSTHPYDKVPRSLLRHDAGKLKSVLKQTLKL